MSSKPKTKPEDVIRVGKDVKHEISDAMNREDFATTGERELSLGRWLLRIAACGRQPGVTRDPVREVK
jgi:hypothetical protein